MENKIRGILLNCEGIIPHGKTRRAIFNNYDIIYQALVDEGMYHFVAHTWTMVELSRLHGGEKVERMLACAA
jgi:hypothetical protein